MNDFTFSAPVHAAASIASSEISMVRMSSSFSRDPVCCSFMTFPPSALCGRIQHNRARPVDPSAENIISPHSVLSSVPNKKNAREITPSTSNKIVFEFLGTAEAKGRSSLSTPAMFRIDLVTDTRFLVANSSRCRKLRRHLRNLSWNC